MWTCNECGGEIMMSFYEDICYCEDCGIESKVLRDIGIWSDATNDGSN